MAGLVACVDRFLYLSLIHIFSYQLGGQILDTNYATMMSMTEFGYAQSPDLLKAWKQDGLRADCKIAQAGKTDVATFAHKGGV